MFGLLCVLFFLAIFSFLISYLYSYLTSNTEAKKRALEWCKTPEELDKAQYLKDLEAIGKGRFAQRLSSRINAEECPEYIRRAIEYVN